MKLKNGSTGPDYSLSQHLTNCATIASLWEKVGISSLASPRKNKTIHVFSARYIYGMRLAALVLEVGKANAHNLKHIVRRNMP
jgi:hypothetical protein